MDPKLNSGIEDIGAIAKFSLPERWKLAKHEEDARGYIYTWIPETQKWNIAGEDIVSLNVGWVGRPLNDREASFLHELLLEPPRALTANDIQKLKYFLDDKADSKSFAIDSARTMDIDGKRVMRITGHGTREAIYVDCLYIDTAGDGRIVQEVSFISPTKMLSTYKADGDKAFSSLSLD